MDDVVGRLKRYLSSLPSRAADLQPAAGITVGLAVGVSSYDDSVLAARSQEQKAAGATAGPGAASKAAGSHSQEGGASDHVIYGAWSEPHAERAAAVAALPAAVDAAVPKPRAASQASAAAAAS